MNTDIDIIVPGDWTPDNSIIKVIGVGGGGCNAVNYMYEKKIEGCSFIVANTDPMSLKASPVPVQIHMGDLGAGTDPIRGRNAAIAASEELKQKIIDTDTKMLFVTAGMGGGTGTGASPVIAKMAKDAGILTVGVVTLPGKDERNGSLSKALNGISELQSCVDSLLVIDNQKIFDIYGDLLLHEAYPKSDEVLSIAVSSIIEIISKPGYINIDFRDVKNMMSDSGLALMGQGEGTGKNRIQDAVKAAMESPLLLDFDASSAHNVLVNVTVGKNEHSIKASDRGRIDEEIAKYTGDANRFKTGIVYDTSPEFGDKVCITVIATGISMNAFNDIYDFDKQNCIRIEKDFVYSPENGHVYTENYKHQVGRSDNAGARKTRKFHYDENNIPVLCTADSLKARMDLESAAAYYRVYPNDEEKD